MKKLFKKFIGLFLVMMIFTSMNVQIFAQGIDSLDIQGHWAADKIAKWTSKEIINGYAEGTFHPDEPMTRAELIKIINGLLGYQKKSDHQFDDVAPTAWYKDEFLKAREAGYFNGYAGNLANPEEEITRQDAVVMLAKAFAVDVQESGVDGFKDADEIQSYAKGAVGAFAVNGLTRGYTDGTFKPLNAITKAEAISMIDNADNNGVVAKAAVISKFLKLTYTDKETGTTMPYRLFVPEGYDPADKEKNYPLVLFLHGGGERGSDNEAQLIANEGATVWARPEEQAQRPCFVLAPQATAIPSGGFGITRDADNKLSLERVFEFSEDLKMAVKILDEVEKSYNLNKSCLYTTGLSQGGFGVWNLNMAYPDRFAAMVPICGGGDPNQAYKIAEKPIWAFHAEEDPIIPVQFSRDAIEALKQAKGNPKYTEYPEGTKLEPMAHFAWVPAYETKEMREWLFQQVKVSTEEEVQ